MASGEYMPWFAFGPGDELPDDQQQEDAGSLVFDLEVTDAPLIILGNATVDLRINSDKPQALVAARLCDVWPDGSSTMITRGILNLSQRDSKLEPSHLIPGKPYDVKVALNHVGYVVPVGHRLRLSLSSSYWPMAWPSPEPTHISIDTEGSQLNLPTRSSDAIDAKLTEFGSTKTGEPISTTQLRKVEQKRHLTSNEETGLTTLEIYADNGKIRFNDSG